MTCPTGSGEHLTIRSPVVLLPAAEPREGEQEGEAVLFIGDDWAEDHHDIELVDDQGHVLARKRLPEGIEGIAGLHALVAEHGSEDWDEAEPEDIRALVKVGIETDR